MSRRTLRLAALLSAILILAGSAILTLDYIQARRLASVNDARIVALQKEVRQDARRAAALHAEQKRITAARDARNTRVKFLSWALIAAAGVFLTSVKRRLANQPESAPALPASKPPATSPPPSARTAGKPPPAAPPPPAIDLAFVDEVVAREGTGAEAAITILQAIQDHYRYLPDEALRRVCDITEITPAQIAGTSSFYSRFRRGPVGKHIVRVCHGTACHVSGAQQITEQLRRDLDIPEGTDTDSQRLFTLEEVACLGCCSLAPVLMVDGHTAGKLTPATAADALDAVHPRERA